MNYNTVRVKINRSGRVTLRLVRKDGQGNRLATFQITVPRRTLERALQDATIEAPWKAIGR